MHDPKWSPGDVVEWTESFRGTTYLSAPVRVVEDTTEGERVLAEWPFPTGWERWEPDPSWQVPVFPSETAADHA